MFVAPYLEYRMTVGRAARRKFLHLAAGAAALPAVSRIKGRSICFEHRLQVHRGRRRRCP